MKSTRCPAVARVLRQQSNCTYSSVQGVGLEAMNAGDQPVIGLTDTYTRPGVYTLEIPCPRTRSTATIHIEMTDEAKTVFVDDFSLSFHMHYYRLLKWLVAVPFTAAALAVLGMKLGGFNDQILPTLGSGSRAYANGLP